MGEQYNEDEKANLEFHSPKWKTNDLWLWIGIFWIFFRMNWLWGNSTVILPSIYMFKEYDAANRARYIYGNIEEGVRVAKNVGGRPVYAYSKIKYNASLPVIFYKPVSF